MTPYSNRLSLKYPLFKNIKKSYWRSAASMLKISENYISRWFPKTELYQRSVSGARRLTSEVAGFDLCKFTESPSENSRTSPIHSSQPATYPLVLLGANCAQSNQRKETFNGVNEFEFEFFDNISLFSHTTVSYAMDSTDIPRQTDSWLDEKRRVIDRECQNFKLGQTAILPDLTDLTHKAGTFPIEKLIENGDILVDIRNNHQMVYHNSVDAHIGAMDAVSVHGNGNSKDDTGVKALHENHNLSVMANLGQLQNQGNKILDRFTYRSMDIKASSRIVCCQQSFSNMTTKASLDVQNNHDEVKIGFPNIRTCNSVTPGKRKQCKKKTNPSGVGYIIACLVCSLVTVEADCVRKYKTSSIEAFSEGNNLLLKCNIGCERDGCLNGTTKWEGGPKNDLLTFGNNSLYPMKYLPITRNMTYDLQIINAMKDDFESMYRCHQKFDCLSAYLPNISIQPTNWTVRYNFSSLITLEADVIGIYPVPEIVAFLGMQNLSSLLIIQPKKEGLWYNCHILLRRKQELCAYNDPLVMSFQLPGIHRIFYNDVLTSNMCPSDMNNNLIAILVPVIAVAVLVFACIGGYIKWYKPKERSNTDGATQEESENLSDPAV